MKKTLASVVLALTLATALAGCGSSTSSSSTGTSSSAGSSDKIIIAWLPNESAASLGDARQEIDKLIEQATGKKVEDKLTTDYSIAIEAVANGTADLAFLGGQGYVEAHNKNAKVLPLVVNSGESGTLDDALYYSWLAVNKGNEGAYKSGDKFVIDNIAGKRFSFVSNSSTSGFKVPSSKIVSYFSKQDKYKSLKAEDLMEGGSGKFFSTVLFGGSHQGSAVNLLTDKVDVAAFCDTCVVNYGYVALSSGTANRPGAVYKVKADAKEPFNTLVGKEFTLIAVTPVQNGPIAVNTNKVSAADVKKLQDLLTSDDVSNNPKIFLPKDTKGTAIFGTKKAKERLVKADDSWYNPIRELSN